MMIGREICDVLHQVNLMVDGLGIAFFSAKKMAYVKSNSDFFEEEFDRPADIANHINKGDITAFCTGSGGDFNMYFFLGQPTEDILEEFPVSVRLALEVQGGSVQFCDVYWLMKWDTDFPKEQIISLEDGYYEMTACTRLPESGFWGEDQTIYIYFQKVAQMPQLDYKGIPDLFVDDYE